MAASKRDNRRFQSAGRFGRKGATYECRCCGRMTRETGHDESDLELCAYCLEESYLENSLSDGNIEQPEFEVSLDKLQKEYKRGKYAKNEADAKTRKIQSSRYVEPQQEVLDTIALATDAEIAAQSKLVVKDVVIVRVGPGLAEVLSLDDSELQAAMGLKVKFAKTFLEIIGTRESIKGLLDTCVYRTSGAFDQPLWYTNSAAQAAKKIRAALGVK